MKSNILAALFAVGTFFSFGQTTVENQPINFSSTNQNMWGPSFSPVSLNQTITLFDQPWNVSWDTGNGGIVSIVGQEFGGALDGSFSGVIGSEIRIEGFTTGEVDVEYPINVRLEHPNDLTYDQGDNVTIQTSYTVQPGYEIETRYPSAGEFFWDFYFQMAAELNATLCFFGCTTFPIIPQFDTGLQTLNLITISGSGASTNGVTGIWFLGPGQLPPYVGGSNPDPAYPGTEPPAAGWPYAVPVETSPTTSPVPNFIPWQCHIGAFPAEIPGAMGLSGEVTIPFVPDVPEGLNGQDLSSCNDSTYFNLNLEVFQLIGGILSYAPGPAGAVGQVLANLSGSQEIGPAEVSWNLFSASFDANITNRQCFNFTPTVYGQFEFPVAVEYTVTDPGNGNAQVSSGYSSIIDCEIGHDINYDFPCYFESVDIDPTYTIDGVIRNHTYDSVSFDFLMSAFAFGFDVPGVTIIPEINVPEICIPVPYPCPSWSCPWCWCTYTACTPAFTIPAVVFPGFSLSVGPLWSTSIPIGNFTYDWFDDTWSLEGFTPQSGATFDMIAHPLSLATSETDILCNGDNTGQIQVVIDAVSHATNYVYTWTDGTVWNVPNSSMTHTGLVAGNYDVSIIDGNGCQLFGGETIDEPAILEAGNTFTDITCNGANDGSVTILAQGGVGGYQYSLNAGPYQASNVFNGLAAGSYTVTVRDGNSCTTTTAFTISEPNVLVQSGIVTDVNCNAGSDGSIDVSPGGGTLPYTYAWTGPGAFSATTEDISNLIAGTYTITITDGRNCTSTAPYTVTQPAAPLALSSVPTDVSCYQGLDGAINITTSGGTAGYTYVWSSIAGGMLPYTSEDISGVPADTYTVIATDQNGCIEQLVQVINEPAAPLSSSPVLTDILCFGDATGVIDPVIAGGTPGYTYNWSNGATTPVATGLIAGNYTLDVTDVNGCTDTYNYTLVEPDQPLNLVLTGVDILCFGDATGSVSSVVTGGTEPYVYAWNTGATTADIDNLVTGTYDLLVTDDHGCTINASSTLIQPAAPLALSSTVVDVDCHGNNSGSIDLTITGGTAPYDHLWSNSGTIILSDTTEDITNQYADTYTVLVTDDHGCQETLITTINEPVAPLAIEGVIDNANCFGLNDGAVDATVTGGTAPYTYSWSNGATTEDITAVLAGNYVLTVTDFNGCTKVASFDISEPAAPINIELFTTDVLCNGDANGIIEADVTGGTQPYMYSWSNGESTEDIEALLAGVYTLTVTDDQGCVAFTGATINEPPALVVTPTVTDASCFGYADGEIVIDIVGGVQPYYFNWGNQNEIMLNNPSETIIGLIAEDYFVRVRDDNGCISEQYVTVGEPAPFVSTYVVTDVLCNGGSDGSVDVTITGGTMPYSTVWSDGQTTEDAVNLSAGMYGYEVTDDQGCIIQDSAYVYEPELIQISYELVPVSCIDQSDADIYVTPYGGTTPYTFLWTTGSVEQNAEDVPPGIYDLTITDDHLCSQTFSFEIMINPDECLDIPNTFTPNGDNYNDTWVIGNIDLYPNATVKVFNKWGNEIYSTSGTYEPWDGTHHANPLPSDVYYYIIILGNPEDNQYTGTITIVR